MSNDSQSPLVPQQAESDRMEIIRNLARETGRSWIGQMTLFARNFMKYPNLVGWMLPSSSFVVRQVLKQIDWKNARVIVEYGPGIGTFTKEILRRMHPEATLIALEVNPDFIEF